jgi:hypothetical protein
MKALLRIKGPIAVVAINDVYAIGPSLVVRKATATRCTVPYDAGSLPPPKFRCRVSRSAKGG